MNIALAIMVKQPIAGRVKTRLSPPLTLEQAAELYRCFVLDKMAQVRRIPSTAAYLAYTPQEADAFFRRLAGEGFSLVRQEGSDLGERLHCLAGELLARGHPGVVISDSDTPSLPDRFLGEAVTWLSQGRTDVILGPAEDGGYYLVGLRRPAPTLFQGVAWSTSAVLEQTLDKAAAAGLRVDLLPPWFDVDTGGDLERLRRDLALNGTTMRHTRTFFQRLAPERAPGVAS